jgi:hypothetical protein
MGQDNDPSFDLEAKLERYKRLLDPALDAMTFENIRALVKEIEEQIAAGKE